MVKIIVSEKLREPSSGKLVGYVIIDTDTRQMATVRKEALKRAIAQGQIECLNMTLTSDGRLIGKTCKNVQNKGVAKTKTAQAKLMIVFGNRKIIVGAFIQSQESDSLAKLCKVANARFINGFTVTKQLANDDNIIKKPFSKIRRRALKVIEDNGLDINQLSKKVTKGDEKYDYIIDISGILKSDLEVVKALVIDNMTIEKIQVKSVTDTNIIVNSSTGIKDVRKALKFERA